MKPRCRENSSLRPAVRCSAPDGVPGKGADCAGVKTEIRAKIDRNAG